MKSLLLPATATHDTFARTWCLTMNNPNTALDDCDLFDYCKNLPHIKYFIFQLEKGAIGTKHYQMYIEFSCSKRFQTMQGYFPRTHIEQRKGTKEQARNYCCKEASRIGSTYEYGDFVEERSRTDLQKITDMIDSGASNEEIRKEFPTHFLLRGKYIEAYRQQFLLETYAKVFRKLNVVYIWGKTGTGKTRYVMEKYGYGNVYRVTNYERGAFDEYKGQPVILFDEYRSSFKMGDMLSFLDGYPIRLPCRYENKTACFDKVYIISNIPLTDQYKKIQEDESQTWDAFDRRIHECYCYDNEQHRNALKNGEVIRHVTILEMVNNDEAATGFARLGAIGQHLIEQEPLTLMRTQMYTLTKEDLEFQMSVDNLPE